MSLFWFRNIPILDLYSRIEQELGTKPYNVKRARAVFAYILWLSFELLFKEDSQHSTTKEKRDDEYGQAKRRIRAEAVALYLPFVNARFREVSRISDVKVLREDVGILFVKLPTRCESADDFSTRIQALANIFEVNLTKIRKTVANTPEGIRSIEIIHKWFEERKITDYTSIIDTWKNIIILRNAPPTHPKINPQLTHALKFFNMSLPIDYTILWDSVLDKFAGSLELFLKIID